MYIPEFLLGFTISILSIKYDCKMAKNKLIYGIKLTINFENS